MEPLLVVPLSGGKCVGWQARGEGVSRRLRVFVSSTMKDLANERDAVCRCLRLSNFEPVNAEEWNPSGAGSWDEIKQKIKSSDAFVLILGLRYGWIPNAGPGSDQGLSVTHLEFNEARQLGLPVLPFLKRLDYDSERNSEDARRRDAFRKEVQDWNRGMFVSDFDLASDLADRVGGAVIQLLTDQFLRGRIEARANDANAETATLIGQAVATPADVQIPPGLAAAVAKREAVLFAGAGISAAAGLPSAAVFSSALAKVIRDREPSYSVSPVGSMFSAIASDVEAFTSHDFLVREVQGIVNPPQGLQPTIAHRIAIELFDTILTTNWDGLFEAAAAERAGDLPLIGDEITHPLPGRCLIKLHGTLTDPASLMLTEDDIYTLDQRRPRLCEAVRSLLRYRTLIVLGSSLRDPSIVKLFIEARPQAENYFIAPDLFAASRARLRKWNFTCIAADADTFMQKLARNTREHH